MSKNWPKVICDPVHKLITFDGSKSEQLLLDLINAKEFQRLRRIKQLGMSELVFPGANHSRFAHSIGVMHLARMILNRLQDIMTTKYSEEQKMVVLSAALLHDLGHGPFSHAFEKITGQHHERFTERIITDSSTEVNKILKNVGGTELPMAIQKFFNSEMAPGATLMDGIPTYLVQVVSSQFDADRFDYLLRDSYHAGTNLGLFEYEYLVHNLFLESGVERLYIGRKAMHAAERYVQARSHMYQSVYFHKTTRSAEVMLKLVFTRFRSLIKDGVIKKTPPGVSRAIFDAFRIKTASAKKSEFPIHDYLDLDDHSVTGFLKWAQSDGDPVLKRLADGVLNRRLYKSIDVSDADAHYIRDFEDEVKRILKNKDASDEYDFVMDRAADTPYKPYDPESGKIPTEIYVEDGKGAIVEIGKLSQSVESMKRKSTLQRFYFPESLRDDVAKKFNLCIKGR